TKYNSIKLKIMINYYIAVGYINLDRNNEACIILENLLSDNISLPSITMHCVFTIELLNLYLTTESNFDSIITGISFVEENSKLVSKSESLQIISQILLIKCKLSLLLKDKPIQTMLNWLIEASEIYEYYKTTYRFSHTGYTINSLFGDVYYAFEDYDNALYYHKLSLDLSAIYEVRYVITSHQKLSKDYAALNDYKKAFIHMEKVDTMRSTIQHANLLENYTKVYKEYENFKENEETKNQFFANLSHELKTPINIIYSSIQLLNIFKDTNDFKFKQYYKKHERSVTQNCLRILKLIDNLIDTTKIDSGSFKLSFVNYDIVKLVEDITLSTLPYVEMKKLNIIFDTDIEQLEIKCDPYAIERIMLNLLSNAIKFTNDGGNINVIISIKDAYVCIKVNDDGIGIPHSMRDQIFEKFIQVDNALNRKKEGSGIGLSLVKSLVELHNGRIYINSTRMRGSEFIILLPNVKILENYDNYICNNYSTNTSKVSAEFSDIYELN
ncbi:MAG: ATP-binding protein, partial [Clostridium sp.]